MILGRLRSCYGELYCAQCKFLCHFLQLLQEELQGSVHALSLTTRTPDEEATELSKGNV